MCATAVLLEEAELGTKFSAVRSHAPHPSGYAPDISVMPFHSPLVRSGGLDMG